MVWDDVDEEKPSRAWIKPCNLDRLRDRYYYLPCGTVSCG